jgi:hypothetical protein
VLPFAVAFFVGIGQGIAEIAKGEHRTATESATVPEIITNRNLSLLQDVFELSSTEAALVYGELQKIGINDIDSLFYEDRDDDYKMIWADLIADDIEFFVCVAEQELFSVSIPGNGYLYKATDGVLKDTVSDYLLLVSPPTETHVEAATSSARPYIATALATTTKVTTSVPTTTAKLSTSITTTTTKPSTAPTITAAKSSTSSTTTTRTTTSTTTTSKTTTISAQKPTGKYIVYWGQTGDKIHINPNCRTFTYTPNSGSLDECKAAGRDGWCGVCSKSWTNERFWREGNPYA